jgi:anionic cell wall polymer biosynthesis LytR-Cps2A-Psr (LCP) family protein
MDYGYKRLYIERGINEFDGETALAYARTRHMDSDYIRGQRQLQVLLAIHERLRNPAALQSLVNNAPQLFEKLDGHYYTNIPQNDMLRLGLAMMQLSKDDITTASINQQFSFNTSYNGGWVRIPDRAMLAELLAATFGEGYGQ